MVDRETETKHRDESLAQQTSEARKAYEENNKLDMQRSCIDTTIQGMSVTLLRTNDNETVFTFKPSGKAGEITEAQLLAAYGSEDPAFVYGLMRRLASVGSKGGSPDVESFEFALAAVRGMAPRNPVEAELRALMVVILSSIMKVANRLAETEDPAEMESAEQSLNRLSRTYCGLTEAFDRHRNEDRKIAVQQISVTDGAQAIVGDVHQNGAKTRRNLNGHANGAKARRKFNGHANGAKAGRKLNGHASA
jgi:hypothetical protein